MTICCNSAGGTRRLTLEGDVIPVRGSVTIMPTRFESTEGANLDGSVFVTHKPMPSTVEMTISDACGFSMSDLHSKQCTDATVELDAVGRTYILVEASIVDRPSLNPETGEISGIKMVCSEVRELNGDAEIQF